MQNKVSTPFSTPTVLHYYPKCQPCFQPGFLELTNVTTLFPASLSPSHKLVSRAVEAYAPLASSYNLVPMTMARRERDHYFRSGLPDVSINVHSTYNFD
jgi:hypothetical protein